jgi:hypothetical protein
MKTTTANHVRIQVILNQREIPARNIKTGLTEKALKSEERCFVLRILEELTVMMKKGIKSK